MAQQDTGLGWSAEQEYLIQIADTVITTLSGLWGDPSVYVGQPIPSGATAYDDPAIKTSGFLAGSGRNNRWRENGAIRFMTETDTNTYCFRVGDVVYIATAESTRVYFNVYNTDNMSLRTGGAVSLTFDTATGLYYGGPTVNNLVSYYPDNVVYTVPEYASISDALATFSILNDTFTKSEAGYSIACVAKWLTENGTELNSPILISSSSELADMSAASGYYFAKTSTLLSGVRFYMGFYQNVPLADLPSAFPTVDITDRGNLSLEQLLMTIISTSYAHVIIINSPDPYETEGGESGEDGGDGDDIQNDEIDFTPAPTSMAVASGFITLFCPSQAELNALADYMWSPLFDVDTLKKLFANPMDCILGLSVIPVPIVPEGTKTVKVGGVSTTVSMGYTNHQYYPVDCGTVTIPKRWGAYMDYTPYTKLNIFLPYIGFRQISADDVMGKTLHLRYMIDILSGACNAELKVNNTVLYSWAGSCAMQIPITGNDWRSAITAGVSIAGSVAATVLSGGASAPMIAGTVASATVNSLALKPEVQRSGSISSASGFLAAQRPYIVRTNPRNAIPANQNKYSGYPSFVTVSLGSLTGYNEVYSVHLENIPATSAELDEIETILKGGAIF